MIERRFIPEAVLHCLSKLEAKGFEAWLVGGAVRDLLMGQTSTDWDIATSATPDQMLDIFRHDLVIPIGIKHGTVRVIFNGLEVDMTTYRVDGPYHDGRRPARVSFGSSIHDDLSRRDFTINAIAYHPTRGLIDPFHGLQDVQDRIIRAVGEAKARLMEDTLRMMRAIRFVSVLGFSLDPLLEQTIVRYASSMDNLPIERLGIEWTKLLAGKKAAHTIAVYMPVLKATLPSSAEAKPYLAWRSVYKNESEPLLRFVAFSLAMDLPDTWFDALMLNKADRRLGRTLRRLYLTDLGPADDAPHDVWRLLGAKVGIEPLRAYYRLNVYLTDNDKHWQALLAATDTWVEEGFVSLLDLAVDGNDLQSLGVPPSSIGTVLERLFQAIISGKVKNERAPLLEVVRLWYNR